MQQQHSTLFPLPPSNALLTKFEQSMLFGSYRGKIKRLSNFSPHVIDHMKVKVHTEHYLETHTKLMST